MRNWRKLTTPPSQNLIICRAMCKIKNVGPLVQRILRTARQWEQTSRASMGPFSAWGLVWLYRSHNHEAGLVPHHSLILIFYWNLRVPHWPHSLNSNAAFPKVLSVPAFLQHNPSLPRFAIREMFSIPSMPPAHWAGC